ncbi:hypothetical protein SLEP1_g56074 [Rubroshorea leprosula]|uniref:Uncharacterized protein n=1 Tax=Rubroshorea leprosula TaxID=152421 RepID=A0AAV5MIK4_9ROSI|nr:hypothetical protein SLEP1_g56074 [Rubroshorea leprosula]
MEEREQGQLAGQEGNENGRRKTKMKAEGRVAGFSLTGPFTDEHQVGNGRLTDLYLIGNDIKAATPPACSRIRGELLNAKLPTRLGSANCSKKLHSLPQAASWLAGGVLLVGDMAFRHPLTGRSRCCIYRRVTRMNSLELPTSVTSVH